MEAKWHRLLGPWTTTGPQDFKEQWFNTLELSITNKGTTFLAPIAGALFPPIVFDDEHCYYDMGA